MAKAHLIGITGVPGTGKSFFARSACDIGPTAVAMIDPKEMTFYAEQKMVEAGISKLTGADSDAVKLIADLDWRPHMRSFKATGFQDLLRWVAARETDDSKYIVIDPMSEVSDLALHEVLKVHSTNDPGDLSHGRAYTGHDQLFKQLLTELRRLVVRGKTVICTFHGKMKELEGAGDAKKGVGMSGGQEWQFEEQMLPVFNSSYRQHIHSPFDLWLYTVTTGYGPGRKYYLTAQADNVRPAKHSVKFKAGAQIARIPNTLKDLLEMLDE